MRQEHRKQETASSAAGETGAASLGQRRLARDAANRWLARFAPLLDDAPTLSSEDVRARLDLIDSLRAESAAAERDLAVHGEPDDSALLTTLQMAAGQLDPLETAFKRRLADLAPGDPEGIVDLAALRSELAEVAARAEIGEAALAGGASLKLSTARANPAAGVMTGIFSLGWMSFTTIHALFMIGGMFSAFGWPALFLLLFYAIFWSVGIAIGASALQSFTTEEILLEDRNLTIERTVLGIRRTLRYRLPRDGQAVVELSASSGGSRRSSPVREILMIDDEGNEIRFGRGAAAALSARNVQQINAYLKARRS